MKNQYNLTQDEQDELDAFLTELDTQSRLEQSETDFDSEAQAKLEEYEEEHYLELLEEDHGA